MFLADNSFAKAEEAELYIVGFLAKKREKFARDNPVKFNGSYIKLEEDSIVLI